MPILYFVHEGSKVDSRTFQAVVGFLRSQGLHVAGALVDRSFCTEQCLHALEDLPLPYEAMLRADTEGYKTMMNKYAQEIAENTHYSLEKSGKFGITDTTKIFKDSDLVGCTALYYDMWYAYERKMTLLDQVKSTRKALLNACQKGELPDIPSDLSSFLHFDKSEIVKMDWDALNVQLQQIGYSAIVSSGNKNAQQIDDSYALRDSADKTIHIDWSTCRVEGTEALYNNFFACVIAAILRSEIANACKRHRLDTDLLISELDLIAYSYNGRTYQCTNSFTKEQAPLLADYDFRDESLGYLYDAVNERLNADVGDRPEPRVWSIPEKKKRGPKSKKPEFVLPESWKFDGMQMGGDLSPYPEYADSPDSKEAADVETDGLGSDYAPPAAMAATGGTTPVPDDSACAAAISPNEETLSAEGESQELQVQKPTVHRMGRPPGSKNKKTLAREEEIRKQWLAGEPILMLTSGSRGRPKGLAAQKREEEERAWRHKAEVAGIPLLVLPKRASRRPTASEAAQREESIRQWKQAVDAAYQRAVECGT